MRANKKILFILFFTENNSLKKNHLNGNYNKELNLYNLLLDNLSKKEIRLNKNFYLIIFTTSNENSKG